MLEDAELLRRYVQDKSETAFAELVARHLDLVYSAALRQVGGDAHRAHDVSQVVFTTLARKAATLVSHPALIGWLYTATQHAALKAVRAEARRRARDQEAFVMQQLFGSDGENIDWERVRPVLDAAMGELNDRDRQAVLLRFFARRAFADIGRTLALSEDAARMRVERAVGKLHALLAKRGVTSTAAALGLALSQHAVLAAPAGLAAGVAGSAVAASGAALGPALVLLQFMSISKIAAGVAGLAMVAVCGSALHEVQASEAAQVANAKAAFANEALAAKVQELRTRDTTLRAMAVQTPAVSRVSAAATPTTIRPGMVSFSRGTPEEAAAFMARYPEVRRLKIEQFKSMAAERYAPLFRELRLTADQIDAFCDLTARGTSFSFSYGNPRRSLTHEGELTGEQRTAALLAWGGPEALARYEDYSRRTAPGSSAPVVSQLAGALYRSPTPLTAEQGARVLEIVLARTAVADARAADWTGILQDAQSVLSAPQLDMLDQLSVPDRLNQMRTNASRAAQPTAPARNPPAPKN